MDKHLAMGALEAILFVAGEPVALEDLCQALEMDLAAVEALVLEYDRALQDDARGLELARFEDGLQLRTKKFFAPSIQRLFHTSSEYKLSGAVMETLSIIAYRQPITRAQIEAIRGVKSDYSISSLLQKDLIRVVGVKDVVGKPKLLGTTQNFLRHFDLRSLQDLPPLVAAEAGGDAGDAQNQPLAKAAPREAAPAQKEAEAGDAPSQA